MPTTQALDFTPTTTTPAAMVPISGAAKWVTAIAAGGLVAAVAEGSPAIAPLQITHSSRRLLTRGVSAGTTLRVRMGYETADAINAANYPLTIRVFGTTDDADWGVLRNQNGDASVPVPIDPTSDANQTTLSNGGNLSFTQPDNNAHSWDCDGCNKFLIAVERPYAPTGTPATAYLQAKIV